MGKNGKKSPNKQGGNAANNRLILITPVYIDGLPTYNKFSEHVFGAVKSGAIKGNYEDGMVFQHKRTKAKYMIQKSTLVEL